MPYLIMPDDSAEFEIDPEDLSRRLHDQWPMVEFASERPDSEAILQWNIIAGNVNHQGELLRDKRTIIIDDYPPGVAEFAAWYAKVFAENQDLFIYHDLDAELEVRITSASTISEIQDRLEGKT